MDKPHWEDIEFLDGDGMEDLLMNIESRARLGPKRLLEMFFDPAEVEDILSRVST